jgi:hypothetical protein
MYYGGGASIVSVDVSVEMEVKKLDSLLDSSKSRVVVSVVVVRKVDGDVIESVAVEMEVKKLDSLLDSSNSNVTVVESEVVISRVNSSVEVKLRVTERVVNPLSVVNDNVSVTVGLSMEDSVSVKVTVSDSVTDTLGYSVDSSMTVVVIAPILRTLVAVATVAKRVSVTEVMKSGAVEVTKRIAKEELSNSVIKVRGSMVRSRMPVLKKPRVLNGTTGVVVRKLK